MLKLKLFDTSQSKKRSKLFATAARMLLISGHLNSALEQASRAIECGRNNGEAYYIRGLIHSAQARNLLKLAQAKSLEEELEKFSDPIKLLVANLEKIKNTLIIKEPIRFTFKEALPYLVKTLITHNGYALEKHLTAEEDQTTTESLKEILDSLCNKLNIAWKTLDTALQNTTPFYHLQSHAVRFDARIRNIQIFLNCINQGAIADKTIKALIEGILAFTIKVWDKNCEKNLKEAENLEELSLGFWINKEEEEEEEEGEDEMVQKSQLYDFQNENEKKKDDTLLPVRKKQELAIKDFIKARQSGHSLAEKHLKDANSDAFYSDSMGKSASLINIQQNDEENTPDSDDSDDSDVHSLYDSVSTASITSFGEAIKIPGYKLKPARGVIDQLEQQLKNKENSSLDKYKQHYELALLYHLEGKESKALTQLDKAATDLPNGKLDTKIYYLEGVIHIKQQDYTKAVKSFSNAIKNSKNRNSDTPFTYCFAYFSRGIAHFKLGENSKGCDNFDRAIKFDSSFNNIMRMSSTFTNEFLSLKWMAHAQINSQEHTGQMLKIFKRMANPMLQMLGYLAWEHLRKDRNNEADILRLQDFRDLFHNRSKCWPSIPGEKLSKEYKKLRAKIFHCTEEEHQAHSKQLQEALDYKLKCDSKKKLPGRFDYIAKCILAPGPSADEMWRSMGMIHSRANNSKRMLESFEKIEHPLFKMLAYLMGPTENYDGRDMKYMLKNCRALFIYIKSPNVSFSVLERKKTSGDYDDLHNKILETYNRNNKKYMKPLMETLEHFAIQKKRIERNGKNPPKFFYIAKCLNPNTPEQEASWNEANEAIEERQASDSIFRM